MKGKCGPCVNPSPTIPQNCPNSKHYMLTKLGVENVIFAIDQPNRSLLNFSTYQKSFIKIRALGFIPGLVAIKLEYSRRSFDSCSLFNLPGLTDDQPDIRFTVGKVFCCGSLW